MAVSRSLIAASRLDLDWELPVKTNMHVFGEWRSARRQQIAVSNFDRAVKANHSRSANRPKGSEEDEIALAAA
jgi:hypothetical protein